MEKKINDFLTILKTENDKKEALFLLDDLLENLFKTDGSLSVFIKKSSQSPVAKSVISLLPDGWENPQDKDDLEKMIIKIKNTVQNLKTVNITVAVNPNETMLQSLNDWASKNFESKIIFDVTVNPEIIGGAIIVSGGTYHDFSLIKRLKDVMEAGKNEIIASLKTN